MRLLVAGAVRLMLGCRMAAEALESIVRPDAAPSLPPDPVSQEGCWPAEVMVAC